MPRLHWVPRDASAKEFWQHFGKAYILEDIIERTIIDNGSGLYDTPVAQVAFAITGHIQEADKITSIIESGQWQKSETIRANAWPYFKYQGLMLPSHNTYYFRIISPVWELTDPMDGKKEFPKFPSAPGFNPNQITWADWKPITGENAWVIIGALQTLYAKNGGRLSDIGNLPKEVRLSKDLLPAFMALRSPLGAVYHAPAGTHGKRPNEISNENCFSLASALRMLNQVTGDSDARSLYEGIESYMKKYGYDKEKHIFHQGGLDVEGQFVPAFEYAVDCQTWGYLVFGAWKIASWYGKDEPYLNWNTLIKRAGYFDSSGKLRGIGYTDQHDVLSTEWTAGAIAAGREIADYYRITRPDWAGKILSQVREMRQGLEELKVEVDEDSDGVQVAYLYSNKRAKIPWGWYGNPIPNCASTAWVYFIDHNFNPFILGGGNMGLPAEKKPQPGQLQESSKATNMAPSASVRATSPQSP